MIFSENRYALFGIMRWPLNSLATLGETRNQMRNSARHCERSEAIQGNACGLPFGLFAMPGGALTKY
jgi:hypothetical protein